MADPSISADPAAPGRLERQRDADRTRGEILDVAIEEFADKGYAGARVDEITARTRTTKRMIYYYFGGKEQLYIAALEQAYSVIRSVERDVDVERLAPEEAIRRLAESTFDHHESHPAFLRLVSIENIDRGAHLAKSAVLQGLGSPAVDVLGAVLHRGREQGVFRADVDAVDVHMMISSFCVFRVANRYTFRAIFDRDLLDPQWREHYRAMLGELVVGYLRRG